MKKRIYEYDIIRTIATFAVIFVHISAIAISGYTPSSLPSVITIFLNRMLKFTTPVFIYLAGSLIYESTKKRPFEYWSFLKSRGKRILIPYVIVSMMYYGLISVLKHQPLSFKMFFEQLLTGSAQYHLYFIPIIIQLYLLTPVFLWLKKHVNLTWLMIVLTGISFYTVLFVSFKYSDRIFIKFIVPYMLGLYFGSDIMTWLKNLGSKIYAFLAVSIASGIYYVMTYTALFDNNNPSDLWMYRNIGWFVYCTLACFLLTLLAMWLSKSERIRKITSTFSKISYYVYLLHPLFIYGMGRVLNKLGVHSVTIRLIVSFVSVSMISTAVAYVIKGISWKRYYDMLSKTKKVALLVLAFILGGSSMVFVYGELVQRGYIPSIKSMTYSSRVKVLQEDNESSEMIYRNGLFGYEYVHDGLSVDTENETIKTTFYNDGTTVDIYYEDLTGTIHSSMAFTVYGNRSIVDSQYVNVEEDHWLKLDDYQVHLLEWSREPLKHIKDDKTYYASMDIVKNDMEVYNITVNSIEPIDALAYLSRMRLVAIDVNDTVQEQVYHRQDNKHWSEETREFYESTYLSNHEMTWGIFEPTSVNGLETLNDIEEKIEYDFSHVLQYYDIKYFIDEDNIQAIYDQGKVLEFTLQTTIYGVHDPDFTMDVLNGVYDDDIDVIVEKVSRIKGPVLFRLNNEMNGDWCFYNAYWFQKDTRLYIALWQYLYNQFEARGADNLIWVFNPNEMSFPGFKWNHYSNYFPGEKYVDIIGVTGYNTGNYYNGETWRDFETIYDEFMPEYKRVFKNYPMMITEFGSSSIGGDKAQWLRDMFDVIDKYDFKVAIYWNSIDYTSDNVKARIYKFDDDPMMIDVIKKYIK